MIRRGERGVERDASEGIVGKTRRKNRGWDIRGREEKECKEKNAREHKKDAEEYKVSNSLLYKNNTKDKESGKFHLCFH